MANTQLIVPTLPQTAKLTGVSLAGLEIPTSSGLHVPGPRTATHDGVSYATSELGLYVPSA